MGRRQRCQCVRKAGRGPLVCCPTVRGAVVMSQWCLVRSHVGPRAAALARGELGRGEGAPAGSGAGLTSMQHRGVRTVRGPGLTRRWQGSEQGLVAEEVAAGRWGRGPGGPGVRPAPHGVTTSCFLFVGAQWAARVAETPFRRSAARPRPQPGPQTGLSTLAHNVGQPEVKGQTPSLAEAARLTAVLPLPRLVPHTVARGPSEKGHSDTTTLPPPKPLSKREQSLFLPSYSRQLEGGGSLGRGQPSLRPSVRLPVQESRVRPGRSLAALFGTDDHHTAGTSSMTSTQGTASHLHGREHAPSRTMRAPPHVLRRVAHPPCTPPSPLHPHPPGLSQGGARVCEQSQIVGSDSPIEDKAGCAGSWGEPGVQWRVSGSADVGSPCPRALHRERRPA